MAFQLFAKRGEFAELRVVQDLAAALHDGTRRGVDEIVVGIHGSRYEPITETADGVDRGATATAGDWLGGEQDSRRVRSNHVLDHDREPEPGIGHVVRRAIRDDALVPERRPAAADGVDDFVFSEDVEDRVLLPCEARLGEVLGGRGRAHRHAGRAERAIRLADRSCDLVGDLRSKQAIARVARIARIDARRARGYRVRLGRDDEAVRDGEARAHELAEVRALPTGRREIARREICQLTDEHDQAARANGPAK